MLHDPKKAKIYPLNRDMNRTWYVEYTDENGRRKKVYGKLNILSTLEERIKEGKKILKKFSPISNNEIRSFSLPKVYPVDKDLNRTWYVEYTTDEKGRRKKIYGKLSHFSTLKEKEAEAQRIIESIPIRADSIENGRIVVVSAGNQLIKDLDKAFKSRTFGCKAKTISAYTTHLNEFVRWYRTNGMPTMDPMKAAAFLNSITAKRRSSTTRNVYRRNLKSFFEDLKKIDIQRYPDNPFAETRKLPEAQKTKEWFRPHQLKKLVAILAKEDPQLLLACNIMFNCFIRPNELRQLKVENVNFETKKFCIQSSIAKTSRTRFVKIPAELFSELQFLVDIPVDYYIFGADGKPGIKMLTRDSLSKRHEKILKAQNFPKHYTFYSWKNTGAVKMLMMDRKPMRYVSKCMGHHSLDMTDKYFGSLGVDDMEESITFPSLNSNRKENIISKQLSICKFQILRF